MCKVEKLIEEFDLDAPTDNYASMEEYIEKRWIGADDQPAIGSVKLAKTLNKQIIRKKYAAHNRNSYQAKIEYPLIMSDDETVERAELAADLKSDGLDIRRLRLQTVSVTTMYTHLKECTSVSKDTEGWQQPKSPGRKRRIYWAEHYAKLKVEDIIRKQTEDGELAHGTDAKISVNTDLICPECGKQVPVRDAIDRGYVCPDHMVDNEDTETGPTDTTTSQNASTSSTGTDESESSSTQTLTETEPSP